LWSQDDALNGQKWPIQHSWIDRQAKPAKFEAY
jgi:hypothetical protein